MSTPSSPDDDDQTTKLVWSKLFKDYENDDTVVLGLQESFRLEVDDCCLVCLEELRTTDPVWSCRVCYNLYHLVCIQRWGQEGALILAANSTPPDGEEPEDAGPQDWCCPKCRSSYEHKELPRKYVCYCGKVENPKPDPWILPHSCGAPCEAKLEGCAHTCKLLCHPGACPPCPKVVKVKCYCTKSEPVAKRCGKQGWSCGKTCSRVLPCKFHTCPILCHDGDCPPCEEKSEQPCLCGKTRKTLPCAAAEWSCEKVCSKTLSCGKHKCGKTCHPPPCEPCLPKDSRTCPCGKSTCESITCIDDQPVCGDTCGKLLSCGYHSCIERCHKGECPPCVQFRTKTCRCSAREKHVACSREFLCDTKCKKKRNCRRHFCNRKCCDGRSCPPCDQLCGKVLGCKNHKCSSVCHTGMCYPCPLKVAVACDCGKTRIRVPCGMEKRVRKPRCKLECERPPKCHHENSTSHKCHSGDCPPCRQICAKRLKCKHSCAAPCHSAVLTDTAKGNLPEGPILPCNLPTPKMEWVEFRCPPCSHPVTLTCAGGHESSPFRCSEAKPNYCCGRSCGQPLPCGNHTCTLLCHDATNTPCEDCTQACNIGRPKGCTHKCTLRCHPAPCPPCKQMIRMQCHCGMMVKHVDCREMCRMGEMSEKQREAERATLLSCGDRCPKLMECGHRCLKKCHQDSCSPSTDCPKKVPVHCPCRRRKVTVQCKRARNETVDCDEDCRETQRLRAFEAEAEALKHRESVVQEETGPSDFKPRAKRSRRNKNADFDENEESRKWRSKIVRGSIAVALVAIFVVGSVHLVYSTI